MGEEEVEDAILGGQTENMLPDIEDAMFELTEANKTDVEKERKRSSSGVGAGGAGGGAGGGVGAQVYFFPGESSPGSPGSLPLPPVLPPCMTQSVYMAPGHTEDCSEEEESDLESFC